MTLLNHALWLAFSSRFGASARVINQGQEARGFYEFDAARQKKRLRLTSWGESYSGDCPFCGDTRGRLSVSHMCGRFDPETQENNWYLWRCYNEDCQKDWKNRRSLRDKLTTHAILIAPPKSIRLVHKAAAERSDSSKPVGVVEPLKEDSAGGKYLAGRGFVIKELVELWGCAGYFSRTPGLGWLADRIAIPVTKNGEIVGWQYRTPYDPAKGGVPKYLSFFSKSQYVYGVDQAANQDKLVLVEGVTDVWRYGPGAVCGFGKVLSETQIEVLASVAGSRPVVVIPDANDPESVGKMTVSALSMRRYGYAGSIGGVELPAGTDPGSSSTEFLRKAVNAASLTF